MTSTLPLGCITMVFADIEASTRGWQELGDSYLTACERLHEVGHTTVAMHAGNFINDTGDGFLLSFSSATDAILCATTIQELLLGDEWDLAIPRLRVRIGIHTGEPHLRGNQYTGLPVWYTHRVMDAAHGTQILVSEATYFLVKESFAAFAGLQFSELGTFRLRDLLAPIRLFRLELEGLSQSQLPPRILTEGMHNLTEEERPFIGRADDLAAVINLIRDRRSRLVTITGIGGMGKTRLAKQAAAALIDAFPDGVWMVRLEELQNREQIIAAICGALQLDANGKGSECSLQAALRSKSLLLVLDCFEHVVKHSAFIEDLLRQALKVSCLVTSRLVLGLQREIEYPLDSMPTLERHNEVSPGVSDSISLFAEAASHVLYDFVVRDDNRGMVSEICSILEGIPLSIILAASRLRHIILEELLQQVRFHRLDVLRRRSDSQTVDKHAALQEVIASSFLLLPPMLQTCLVRLSVFAGGFYFEDAEAICVDEQVPNLRDSLDTLREHSLVQVQLGVGRTRYRLLDTVREYLHRLSDTGASFDPPLYLKHAEHYSAFARRMDDQIKLGNWQVAKDNLWSEIANLRAAIRYASDANDDELLCNLVDALAMFLQEIGLWSELQTLALVGESAMERTGKQEQLSRLLGIHGALARRLGDETQARILWERKLTISEQRGDLHASADVLIDLARQAQSLDEQEYSQAQAMRAVAIARELHRNDILADALSVQADNARSVGEIKQAIALGEQAFDLLSKSKNVHQGSLVVVGMALGIIYKEAGDNLRSEELLLRVANCAFEIEHTFALGRALLLLGELFEDRANQEGAALAYYAASRIHTQLKSRLAKQAEATLLRFRQNQDQPDTPALLQKLSRRTWKDIVVRLLKESKSGITSQITEGNDDC